MIPVEYSQEEVKIDESLSYELFAHELTSRVVISVWKHKNDSDHVLVGCTSFGIRNECQTLRHFDQLGPLHNDQLGTTSEPTRHQLNSI